jgi:hypothetical protein
MQSFFADIAHDLREKRLWPVAVALLVALIAIPVVFMKPAEDPESSGAESASDTAAAKRSALAKLALVDVASEGGSGLSVFDSKNPFMPPKAVLAAKANEASSTASSTATSGEDAKGGGSGSDAGGSGGAGGGGGGTTSPGDGGGTTSPAKPQAFTYVADVRFGRSGHLSTYNGLSKLQMLPNSRNPLLIFLGADEGGGNAVFLVDSTLRTTGEGTCTPSPSECATLAIGAGAEHEFVDPDGRSYTLLIRQIRPVSTKSASAARAAAAVGSHRRGGRRFQAPILADIVTTADLAGGDSRAGGDGR